MAQAKATGKTKKRKARAVPKKRVKKEKTPAIDGGSRVPIERLALVEKMMAAMVSKRDITRAICEKYSVSARTAYTYYSTVEKEWREATKETRAYSRFKAVKALETAVVGATKDRKWSALVRAVEAQARLLGLNEPDEVIIVTEDDDPLDSMTSAQLRAYTEIQREEADRFYAEFSAARTH